MSAPLLSFDPWTLAAIAAMAVATYVDRAGGYVVFRRIRPSRGLRIMLDYIPGTLFVSYVVPALTEGGLQPWVGAVATAGVMVTTRNTSLAIIAGTLAAWMVWAWPYVG